MNEENLDKEKEIRKKEPSRGRLNGLKRYWLTIAFFMGFVIDNLTLNRVDELLDNIILAFQVTLSMVSILLLYASVANKLSDRMSALGRKYLPMIVQYSFGGLLSGMLIFYGRSGDFFSSWPFLLIIVAAILGNEGIKDRSSRLLYNLGILFIGVMSYVILVIPVITGKMGALVFVVSGLTALMVMYFFTQLLYRIIPNFMNLQLRAITFTIGGIFVAFNFLYFTNIIPPIPLSLKELGIYHSVVKFEDGTYQLKWIEKPWYQPFTDSDKIFYPSVSSQVYCFASVFAPTKLDTKIYHKWEYQNSEGDWIEHARLQYQIFGGSSVGYRGYTLIRNHQTGKWRCSVETERGQSLGRATFEVAPSTANPPAELIKRVE